MSERTVRLWARIAAWPILVLTLLAFGAVVAAGELFSALGLFMGIGLLLMTAIFLPVALRGTEPVWLSNESHPGMLLFDLLGLSLVVAFFAEMDALLRLTPGFFFLIGALTFLLFAGGLRQKLLPDALVLAAMLVSFPLLLSSPFWAAGLAPQSAWTDRMLVVMALILVGTVASRLLRAVRRPTRG